MPDSKGEQSTSFINKLTSTVLSTLSTVADKFIKIEEGKENSSTDKILIGTGIKQASDYIFGLINDKEKADANKNTNSGKSNTGPKQEPKDNGPSQEPDGSAPAAEQNDPIEPEVLAGQKKPLDSNYIGSLIREVLGAYSATNAQNTSGKPIPAFIVISGYFGNDGSQNNSVFIFINDISNFSNTQSYLNATQDDLKTPNNKQEDLPKVENTQDGNVQPANVNPATEEPEQPELVVNAPDEVKAVYNITVNMYSNTTVVLDYDKQTTEVLTDDGDKKNQLLDEVLNLDGINNLQDQGKMYEIVKGDTLWQISQDNNISLEELKNANPWTESRFSPDGNFALIHPGEQLNIPLSLENEIKRELNVSGQDLQGLAKNSVLETEKLTKTENDSQELDRDLNRATQ